MGLVIGIRIGRQDDAEAPACGPRHVVQEASLGVARAPLVWLARCMRTLVVAMTLAMVAAPAGCRVEAPASGPEAQCVDGCRATVHACSDVQCVRECRFILDRLVEREGAQVLACVARAKGSCDEMTFADCAARSGPYANGGPAPPRPPSDDEE